ncbi:putative holin [Pseudomonas sp. M30-35]|uniref:putative holin n=1 Tax=Pseudomonas sp. M30-35 TaxID=1981174 RepID=UPI002113DBAC|nr:putative holin [Pseudomonas sp. M30-35]
MSNSCTPRSRLPRMTLWTIITLCLLLLLAFVRPEQLQVILYKSLLVTLAAVIGYWIDRSLFPYVQDRPHQCIGGIHIVGAWLRRALIVLACVLGMTLGL